MSSSKAPKSSPVHASPAVTPPQPPTKPAQTPAATAPAAAPATAATPKAEVTRFLVSFSLLVPLLIVLVWYMVYGNHPLNKWLLAKLAASADSKRPLVPLPGEKFILHTGNVPMAVLFIMFLLCEATAVIGVCCRVLQFGKLNNDEPRADYPQLQGRAARALGTHLNSQEALMYYGIGLAVALLSPGPVDRVLVAQVSLYLLFFRLLHAVMYYLRFSTARSVAFFIGYLLTALLYLQPLMTSAQKRGFW